MEPERKGEPNAERRPVIVMTGLIILNTLLIAFTDANFPWAVFPLVGWGHRTKVPLHLRLSASRNSDLRAPTQGRGIRGAAERSRLGHFDRKLGEGAPSPNFGPQGSKLAVAHQASERLDTDVSSPSAVARLVP